MTDERLIKEYVNCWKAINQFKAEEARLTSVELRWQQFIQINGLAKALGITPIIDERENAEVNARWVKIKNDYENSRSNE